jgi:hypothetical protein
MDAVVEKEKAVRGLVETAVRSYATGFEARRGGSGCLNRFSASIGGASAGATDIPSHKKIKASGVLADGLMGPEPPPDRTRPYRKALGKGNETRHTVLSLVQIAGLQCSQVQ